MVEAQTETLREMLAGLGWPSDEMPNASSGRLMSSDAPTFEPIKRLHGDHPGEVLFCRDRSRGTRTPREMESLGSVRVSDLDEIFPQYLAPLTEDDAFQTVNGLGAWDGAKPLNRFSEPKIRHRRRLSGNIDWLTSCWVDLDFARDGSTFNAFWALGALDRHLVFPGHLPNPSMFAMSGRGLWLFWLLRGPDGREPIKANADRIALQKRCNREIAARIAEHAPELLPDTNATDAARVCRVPGSRNTSAGGARVAFGVLGEDTYTPEGLASLLNIARPSTTLEAKPSRQRLASSEQAIRGAIVASGRRLDRLAALFTRWGSIREGKRNDALFVFACALRWAKTLEHEALDRLDNINAAFADPPLPRGEVEKILASAQRGRFRFSDGEIVHRLEVSDEDASAVGFPTRAQTREAVAVKSRAEKARQRRDLIEHWIRKRCGEVPTIDDAREYLSRYGVEVSRQTIANDYRHLGLVNPRGRASAAESADMFTVMETADPRLRGSAGCGPKNRTR